MGPGTSGRGSSEPETPEETANWERFHREERRKDAIQVGFALTFVAFVLLGLVYSLSLAIIADHNIGTCLAIACVVGIIVAARQWPR